MEVPAAVIRDAAAQPARMRQRWVDARVRDSGQYEAHQLTDALARLDKARLRTASSSRTPRVLMELATIKTMARRLQEAADTLRRLATDPETPEDIREAAGARYPELLDLLAVAAQARAVQVLP